MGVGFSKEIQVLRDQCIKIQYEIISCMPSQVIFKIYENGFTPNEIVGLYIYKKFVDEQNEILPERNLENLIYINTPYGIKIIRLILNDTKSVIIDIEFKDIMDNK